MEVIWLRELSSEYILTSITNFAGYCGNLSGDSFLLLPIYFNEKAEMTNDNRPGTEVKCVITCHQYGDGLHNLGKAIIANTLYMEILFFLLNILVLKCIN